MALAIEDYALIGDGFTGALVGRDGSIDWLCWPRFDSGACFAALLGTPEHGRWRIAATDENARVTRRYRDDTLILETHIETDEGAATVIDFMPVRNGWSELVRIVVGKRGTVNMQMDLVLRFDYGSAIPWVSRLPDGSGISAIVGPDRAVLRTPVELVGKDMHTVAAFSVSAGQSVPFVLAYSPSHHKIPHGGDPASALGKTENYWKEWSSRCQDAGKWSAPVKRSLITLKALAYQPTGGIVAAPTASLPEMLGGSRNWDYRYCWLRDATITLLALMRAGYYEEASAWRDWLARAMAGSPAQVQIMYGIAGERRLSEWEADWLPGYQGARPVRIGNNAVNQLQLDVYGEVMNALHVARVGGLQADDTTWAVQQALVGHLEDIWMQPDNGIWETRGGPQQFTFSKVMAWVALDRAVKSVEQFSLDGPVERWRDLRKRIHEDICRNAWSDKRDAFVQAYGSEHLDASTLLMPQLGFLPPTDPRVIKTVNAVQKHLSADGLILRYDSSRASDGLPPGEGTFLACSFWMVDSLALIGRHTEACEMYERLLLLRNDVGLLAEEYDPGARRQVGNFPQAFSHVALTNTAFNLLERQESVAAAAGKPKQGESRNR